jgi:hypothetical protein
MWQLLIGSATELIGGHFKRKSEEKQAQHERKLETIKHEANWDNIQATNAGNSWKDEWFTVLFLYRLSWLLSLKQFLLLKMALMYYNKCLIGTKAFSAQL